MKTIYLYLLDAMAEWEVGNILQALRMASELGLHSNFQIKTLAHSKRPIRTLGGPSLMPNFSFGKVSTNKAAALLPVAATRNQDENSEILSLTETLLEKKILVAAIYGATLALAIIASSTIENTPVIR